MCVFSPTLPVHQWIYTLTLPSFKIVICYELLLNHSYPLPPLSAPPLLKPGKRKHQKKNCSLSLAEFQIVDFDDQLHIFLESCHDPRSHDVFVDPSMIGKPNHTWHSLKQISFTTENTISWSHLRKGTHEHLPSCYFSGFFVRFKED